HSFPTRRSSDLHQRARVDRRRRDAADVIRACDGLVNMRVGVSALGGLVGGLAGATTAVVVTEVIKAILTIVSRQGIVGLIVFPLIGLVIAVVILQGYHRGEALQTLVPDSGRQRTGRRWSLNSMSTRDVIRADLTADVLA